MIPLGMHWYGGTAAAAAEAPEEPSAFVAVGWSDGKLQVPESAVVDVEGKPTVFVMERDLHLLVATPIALGDKHGAARDVVSGVTRGQLVVTDGLSTERALAAR